MRFRSKVAMGCVLAGAVSHAWSAGEELPFTLERCDVRLRVEPETRRVAGRAELVVEARDAVEEVTFALNDLLRVTAVEDGARATTARTGADVREGRGLVVTLDPPLAPGDRRTIAFEYEGIALDPGPDDADWMGVLLVRPDEVRMSHQAQWLPIVPQDDAALAKLSAPTRLELELPAGFESLGPGRLVGVKGIGGGYERHVWESTRPVRASVLAGTYEAIEVKAGGESVRVLARSARTKGARAWAEEALAATKALTKLLGPPPEGAYGLASMTVRNRKRSYNYEADGFSVVDEVLFDGREPDARKMAHEIAHRWFGGKVDASGPGERFLTESLAEVAAWLAVEARSGEEAAREAVRAALDRYGTPDASEHPLARTTFASPRYSPVVYAKGPLALWTLRTWVGKERFLKGLRGYLERHEGSASPPSLADFVDAMRDAGGDEVDLWATEWLERAELPRYRVELEPRGATTNGRLIQEGALFHHPVELELRLANGRTKRITVEPTDASTPFTARTGSPATTCVVDPDRLLLHHR